METLIDRMFEEMKLRSFAAATQKSYLYAVATLAKLYWSTRDLTVDR